MCCPFVNAETDDDGVWDEFAVLNPVAEDDDGELASVLSLATASVSNKPLDG